MAWHGIRGGEGGEGEGNGRKGKGRGAERGGEGNIGSLLHEY